MQRFSFDRFCGDPEEKRFCFHAFRKDQASVCCGSWRMGIAMLLKN